MSQHQEAKRDPHALLHRETLDAVNAFANVVNWAISWKGD